MLDSADKKQLDRIERGIALLLAREMALASVPQRTPLSPAVQQAYLAMALQAMSETVDVE